jgi:stage IV sporulation protein B
MSAHFYQEENMKKLKILPSIGFISLMLLYLYVSAFINVPSAITVVRGTDLSAYTFNRYSKVAGSIETDSIGKNKVSVELFGKIPLKEVKINIVSDKLLIASGQTIGIKLNTNGVTVLSFEEFFDSTGKKVAPYEGINIKRGDVIIKFNNENINGVEDFISKIQNSNGKKVELTLKRGDEENLVYMTPIIDKSDNTYKLGLWVKEITSGVGTVTYIDKNTGEFGALGHGINDVDGTSLLGVRTGNAYKALILAIEKGKKGIPGELKGAIRENDIFGTIDKNTPTGIYGLTNLREGEEIQVALAGEITEGPATIYCNIDGNNVKEYKINIEKINSNLLSSKNMIIKVTDEELIAQTGGIVQGMSGSPIIQNGKLIGAVTHVLINDPTRGYGIFIENMLEEAS